ncbi:EF-hand domain-containing protein [Pseudorhodobacter turbinis]|uniref:EF-hand domain-containing protein n=1 Tax=Pseudorhodobacter turbinis TaxID=2500533 RepID=A0A4P8EEE9_9RHOB|nr:EF-hand domain-containing protein [Pseudorhodobacter turbinis]QCO55117.1 EF-hand domain-containing protein [Pseudorhodobacter turbinis]
MKRFILTLSAISAFAVAQANAQTVIEDLDGDGAFSMAELSAAYPAITAVQFSSADRNTDGLVDMGELANAVSAGTISE